MQHSASIAGPGRRQWWNHVNHADWWNLTCGIYERADVVNDPDQFLFRGVVLHNGL